eukprot:4620-Heterococcus_DN1.PRE.1
MRPSQHQRWDRELTTFAASLFCFASTARPQTLYHYDCFTAVSSSISALLRTKREGHREGQRGSAQARNYSSCQWCPATLEAGALSSAKDAEHSALQTCALQL